MFTKTVSVDHQKHESILKIPDCLVLFQAPYIAKFKQWSLIYSLFVQNTEGDKHRLYMWRRKNNSWVGATLGIIAA